MDKQQEFALRTVEERDVRFIRLWFTDVLGTLKSVAIAPAELEAAFEEGLGFDGSAIEGMTRVSEDDMIVQPDPSTFQILPWRGGPQVPLACSATFSRPTASRPWVTRATCSSVRSPRRRRRVSRSTCTRRLSSICSRTRPTGRRRRLQSTRAAISTMCRAARAWTSAAPPSTCWSRWHLRRILAP